MRRPIVYSGFTERLVIITLATALAVVVLGATAFGQQKSTPEPTSLSTEYTSTPTPEATASTQAMSSAPESTSPSTPTAKPETTAATTPESTTEHTTSESTPEQPGGIPSITVNPTEGPPGTTVTVTGRGWQDFAGEQVDIQTGLVGGVPGALDPLPARTSARPDDGGTFSVPLTIPESVPVRRQVKIMAILGNGGSVDASFTVTPAKSETSGGTDGQNQPSNPNKATNPQGSTPNGPGNPQQYTGGPPPKQGQHDQQKNGLLTGIRRLLNSNFGSGNAHKQAQNDQQKNGLITRIVEMLPRISVPWQGELPKPLHPLYCTVFTNASSCQGEGTGQGKQQPYQPDQKPPTTKVAPSKEQAIKAPVPYKSQFNEKIGSGCNNCGPASVAMALAYYGKNISVDEAAIEIRGEACGGNTDFKGNNTKALLEKNGLKLVDVDSFESIKSHLDLGRPVLMLVKNDYYVREVPGEKRLVPYYKRSGYAQHENRESVNHIVVVTGYDHDNVYINDPLAVRLDESGRAVQDPGVGKNFPVPIETFKRAAGDAGSYGTSVTRK